MSTQPLTETLTFPRRNAVFGVFCLILTVFAFTPLQKLFEASLNLDNTDLSYIVLIPFISGALIYWDRQRIFRTPRISVVYGAFAFVFSGLLYFLEHENASRLGENDQLSLTISAVIAVFFSGFLLCYGTAAFKAALFPLLFLTLAIPMPAVILDAFTRFLQHGSASLSAVLFALTGTPVYRNDVAFMLPNVTIIVAEECSGIRSTIGIFIVTLLGGHMLLRSNWRRLILLMAVVPLSLIKNAIRIVTLTLLAVHVDMGFLTGSLHRQGGIVFMMIGLALLYPLLTFLMRSERDIYSGVQP
jgi:exosortase